MPLDFESAVSQIQKLEGLDRGQAVARLKEAYDNNDPQIGKISDIGSALTKERVKSFAELIPAEVVRGAAELPESVIRGGISALGYGKDLSPEPRSEEFLKQIQSQVEPLPKYVGGTAELAGGAAGYGAPWEATEAGLAKAVPWLAKGAIPTMIRGSLAGAGLGFADTRTWEGAKTGAEIGAIAPPASFLLSKILGSVGSAVGEYFGREEEPSIDAEFSKVKPETQAPVPEPQKALPAPSSVFGPEKPPMPINLAKGEWSEGGPAFTMRESTPTEPPVEPGPIPKPATSVSGEVNPAFPKKAPNKPEMSEAKMRAKIRADLDRISKRAKIKARDTSDRALAEAGASNPVPENLGGVREVLSTSSKKPVQHPLEPGAHVGTAYTTTGQPFNGTKTVLLQEDRGRVFVNADHPGVDLGTPTPVSLKNPAVLMVGHDTPYRDALTKLYPSNKEMLSVYDQSEKPDSVAREFLGRFAKQRGYDGFILKTPDTSRDIIIDFSKFKSERVPSQFTTEMKSISYDLRTQEPPRTVFSRSMKDVEEAVFGKTEPIKYPETGLDLNKVEHLDLVAKLYGSPSAKALATDIRASKYTPFEMLQHAAKAQEAPPVTYASGLKVALKVPPTTLGDLRAAIQAVTNRFPRVMTRIVSKFIVRDAPEDDWLAQTRVGTDGRVVIDINSAHLPNTKSGQESLESFGYKKGEEKEWLATTIEHELTHAVQFWADSRGLWKTFGVPQMVEDTEPETPGTLARHDLAEKQAQQRDVALTQFFNNHKKLIERVNAIPEHVKVAILRAHVQDERVKLKPIVMRRYNQVTNKNYMAILARKKTPDFTPIDMDSFDNISRSGPLDSEVAPDSYFSPEVKSFLTKAQQLGMKWGGWFSKWRNSWDVSDNPDHLYFHAQVFRLAHEMQVQKALFNENAGTIIKNYLAATKGDPDVNYDKVVRAVEGLNRASDGHLFQTLPDVDEITNKYARKFRDDIFDAAYEYVTGIDRMAPVILKELKLPDTPKQWWRIKMLQEGFRSKVKDPSLDEFSAATRMKGMLNFDESNDLRMEYVDGYMTQQPIQNERVELLNQIRQANELARMSGVFDATSQELRQKKIKRLETIELELARQYIKSGPRSDVVSKHHFFGPAVIKDHPGAAEVVVDKHLPQVVGRYVNGIVTKRYFDQVLHEFRKVSPTLPGSVREYNVNYINNLRGLRGFKEDQQLTNFLNEVAKLTKSEKRWNINDVRRAGEFSTQFQTVFKLLAGAVRFPAVQLTHPLMTILPAAGDMGTFVRGLNAFYRDPKGSIEQVMARGLIEKDAEFVAALDKVTPAGGESNIIKALSWLPKVSDHFRKALAWQTFRLQYLEPGFKPDMNLAKTFVKDVPGRSVIEASKDYADAMTTRTQFDLRAHGKPTGFVGGQVRRSMTQFKPWIINYGTLYKDILKGAEGAKGWKQRSYLLGVLCFVGGPTAVLGGDMMYNLIRNELIKHGIILPRDTGFQQVANMMGWGDLVDVDVLSLRDPLGLPRDPSLETVGTWVAGPALATVYEAGRDIHNDWGQWGKMTKDVIGDISPAARAGIDSYEEWKNAGVKSPTGQMLGKRPTASVIIRGLDMSPSLKTMRYQYRNDIVTALENGHPDTALKLQQQARAKGIIFGPKDMKQIRSTAKSYVKKTHIPFMQQMR